MSKIGCTERREDMSSFGKMSLYQQEDGDVVVYVHGRDALGESVFAVVEFCSPGAGGGRSPNTLKALRKLAEAMELDNADHPTP